MNTLLLTGTIQPNNDNKQKSTVFVDNNFFDPVHRLRQYTETILYYITHSNFDAIVFCENSKYPIDQIEQIKKKAKLHNKKFELLQFTGTKQAIIKYSYHYGEAEIFDYAFENSILLKSCNNFFKATGRYIIKNINDLINDYTNYPYFFYKGFGLNSTLCVNTAFFKVSKDFYEKNLYKKHLEYYHIHGDNRFIPLEGVYYQILKNILFRDHYKIKSIPIFHFFKKRTIVIENIKKKLGLLNYGTIGRVIERIILKLRFLHKKFY